MSRALHSREFRTGGDRSPQERLRPAVLAIFLALLFVLTIAAISPTRLESPGRLAASPCAVLGAGAPAEGETVADGTGADCLEATAGRNAFALLPIAGPLHVLSARRQPAPATRPEASRAPPAAL